MKTDKIKHLLYFVLTLFSFISCKSDNVIEIIYNPLSEQEAKILLTENWYNNITINNVTLKDSTYKIQISNGKNILFTNSRNIILDIEESKEYYTFIFRDKSSIDIKKTSAPALSEFKNNPYPKENKTIKILALGNSYTEDANSYLNAICRASGIDQEKFCIYEGIMGGSSLEKWTETYKSNENIKLLKTAGKIEMGTTNSNVKSLLSQDWDIIVLQQVSWMSTDYSTFNPYLKKLITLIRENCTNPKVSLAWQMIWAYKSDYGDAPYGGDRWNKICEVVKKQIVSDGIDIIIPTGTAIENARHTSLKTEGELTRDGTHLSFGTGIYIAGCTWFESLLAPFFNTSIIRNSAVHSLTDSEIRNSKYKGESVTSENAALCQKCAANAVKNRFTITPVEN